MEWSYRWFCQFASLQLYGYINNIALALKEYTRVNYPSFYNSNVSFNSYLSMAYNGLQKINGYNNFLNSLPENTEQEKKDNLEQLKIQ